jgi:hypothetical protein
MYTPKDAKYPIPYHDTWDIIDSSKLTTYLTCPRKFFFNYVLGWDSVFPNKHLIFGKAIHKAFEYILIQPRPTTETIQEAYEIFMGEYRKEFTAEDDEYNKPKTPEYVFPLLVKYCQEYESEWETEEVLHTEVAGIVPVSEENFLNFRIDLVRKGERGIYCMDHKTTGYINETWMGQWELAIQVFVYIHFLYSHYPVEDVYGMIINGIGLSKRKNVDLNAINLQRVKVRKTMKQLDDGLKQVSYYLDRLKEDYRKLSEAKDTGNSLQCFYRNPEACTKYFKLCKYHAICTSCTNPLQIAEEVPHGFTTKFWDPRTGEADDGE